MGQTWSLFLQMAKPTNYVEFHFSSLGKLITSVLGYGYDPYVILISWLQVNWGTLDTNLAAIFKTLLVKKISSLKPIIPEGNVGFIQSKKYFWAEVHQWLVEVYGEEKVKPVKYM